MKKLFLITAILAFVGAASATTIPNQNVTVDLENSQVNISMEVRDMTSSVFYYTSSYPVENDLTAFIDGERVSCNKEPLPPGTYITCETDKEDFDIDIAYETDGLVSERSGVNIFRYTQTIQRPTIDYRMRAYLPQGSGLVEEANVSLPVVSPEGGQVSTDGQRIFIEWRESPDLGQLSFQAIYRNVEEDPGSSGMPGLIWLIPIFVISLILGAVYLAVKSREDIDEAYEELSEDEKEVLDMIRENSDSMLQKDIVDESEYSKAKISSVISGLEEEGIVKKSKEGRSNKISIARKYRY